MNKYIKCSNPFTKDTPMRPVLSTREHNYLPKNQIYTLPKCFKILLLTKVFWLYNTLILLFQLLLNGFVLHQLWISFVAECGSMSWPLADICIDICIWVWTIICFVVHYFSPVSLSWWMLSLVSLARLLLCLPHLTTASVFFLDTPI